MGNVYVNIPYMGHLGMRPFPFFFLHLLVKCDSILWTKCGGRIYISLPPSDKSHRHSICLYIIQIMETYSHISNKLPLRCIEKVLIYVSRQVTIVFQIPPEKMFEVCFACKGFLKPRVIPKPELWNGKPLTIEQQIKPLIWVPLWISIHQRSRKVWSSKGTPRISRYQQTWICLFIICSMLGKTFQKILSTKKMVWTTVMNPMGSQYVKKSRYKQIQVKQTSLSFYLWLGSNRSIYGLGKYSIEHVGHKDGANSS